MEKVPLYILAGGAGSRGGSDRARVVDVVQRLGRVASSVTVVGEVEGEYDALGLRTIGELEPGLGPLGGLLTAMGDAGDAQWVLIAACDLAGAKAEWAERLWESLDGAAQAAAFKGDRWQEGLGLYRVMLRGAILRQMQTGRRALRDLLDRCDAVGVELPRDWGGPSPESSAI